MAATTNRPVWIREPCSADPSSNEQILLLVSSYDGQNLRGNAGLPRVTLPPTPRLLRGR